VISGETLKQRGHYYIARPGSDVPSMRIENGSWAAGWPDAWLRINLSAPGDDRPGSPPMDIGYQSESFTGWPGPIRYSGTRSVAVTLPRCAPDVMLHIVEHCVPFMLGWEAVGDGHIPTRVVFYTVRFASSSNRVLDVEITSPKPGETSVGIRVWFDPDAGQVQAAS